MNRTFYRCVVFLMLLTMMGIIAGIASPGLADTDLGVVGTELHLPVILSTAVLYVLILSRLFFEPQRFVSSSRALFVALPLVFFCTLSAGWSNDPSLTFRRSLFLVLTVLVALIIGTDFELRELGRLLAAASVFHIALCAIFYVVAPHYIFSPQDPNSLKGLTTHKNVFGFEQGIAVLALLFVPFKRLGGARWPLAAVAMLTLFLSHSSGSLLATIVALCCWPLLQLVNVRRQERLPIAMLAIVGVAGAVALLVENAARIPELFSKDATLTGRTELWSILLVSIQQHLWIGYGFDSFWQGLQGNSLNVIRAVGWLVPTAHNGYLDLLLSVGVIGAALMLPLLIQGIRRALRYTASGDDSARFFPAVMLVFWLVYNLNESALLTRSGLPFFLFIAVTTSLYVPHAAQAEATSRAYLDGYALSEPSTTGGVS
jgi:exopolysaccharide production protein ExoQ